MSTIRFTQNYQDLSTDRGYQFKFFCDRCGNGVLSGFQTSVVGTAGGLLRAAGNLFGGVLGEPVPVLMRSSEPSAGRRTTRHCRRPSRK
jgi:hypothetical protein